AGAEETKWAGLEWRRLRARLRNNFHEIKDHPDQQHRRDLMARRTNWFSADVNREPESSGMVARLRLRRSKHEHQPKHCDTARRFHAAVLQTATPLIQRSALGYVLGHRRNS